VEANQQIITLHSVLKAHNTLFDPTIIFLAMFFARGDFAKKYQVRPVCRFNNMHSPKHQQTIDELVNDNSAEILLDPEKKEQPLQVSNMLITLFPLNFLL